MSADTADTNGGAAGMRTDVTSRDDSVAPKDKPGRITQLALDIDISGLTSVITQRASDSILRGVEESLRYGAAGSAITKATAAAIASLADEVISDPGFRARAREALERGILAGVEERGRKMGRAGAKGRQLTLVDEKGGDND